MQQIEIKRKVFDVVQPMGERSFKVSRKGDFYFLKDFGNDKEGFEDFVDRTNTLKVTGVKQPKVYLYDKNSRIIVLEFIEGEFMNEYLSKEDATEEMVQKLFQTFWFGKIDKLALEMKPGNFKWYKNNLYYIPFKFKKFSDQNYFLNDELFYWFATPQLEKYLSSAGISFDHKRIKSEYEINKQITLLSIKYYR